MRIFTKKQSVFLLMSAMLLVGSVQAFAQGLKVYNLSYTADGSVVQQAFTVTTSFAGSKVTVEFPDGAVEEQLSSEENGMAQFVHMMGDAPKPWVVKIAVDGVQSFASQMIGMTGVDVSKCQEIKRIILPNQSLEQIDLKGLVNLEQLFLQGNEKIKEIDASDLESLTFINLSNNPSIKVKGLEKCAALKHIIAYNSGLANPDVSNFKDLEELDLTNTGTTAIDLADNTKLVSLELTDNKLEKLDVTMLGKLESLMVGSNQLTEIDLSKNTALLTLNVSSNQLSKLNIAAEELSTFDCGYNNLPLSQLPPKGSMQSYIYWPQGAFAIQPQVVVNTVLDMSAEAKAIDPVGKTKATVFSVYSKDKSMLEEGTDYTIGEGKITFLKAFDQPLRLKLVNSAFPKLKDKYAMYSDWFNVVTTDGVADVAANGGMKVSVAGGELLVSGLKSGERVAIYGADGSCRARLTAVNGSATLSVAKGLYVVKAEGKAVKVLVK